jgi:hypothetical protein
LTGTGPNGDFHDGRRRRSINDRGDERPATASVIVPQVIRDREGRNRAADPRQLLLPVGDN